MNALVKAILEGRTEDARSIGTDRPDLLAVLAPSGVSLLRLARDKGVVRTEVALIRLGAAGGDVADWPRLLVSYLEALSYTYAVAGWLIDIEHDVWRFMQTREPVEETADPYRLSELLPSEFDDLEFLSERADGWPLWNEDAQEALVVPLNVWRVARRAWLQDRQGRLS